MRDGVISWLFKGDLQPRPSSPGSEQRPQNSVTSRFAWLRRTFALCQGQFLESSIWIFAPKHVDSLLPVWHRRERSEGPLGQARHINSRKWRERKASGQAAALRLPVRSTALLFGVTSSAWTFWDNQSILVFGRKASKVAAAWRSLPLRRALAPAVKLHVAAVVRRNPNHPWIYCFHARVKVSTLFFLMRVRTSKNVKTSLWFPKIVERKGQDSLKYADGSGVVFILQTAKYLHGWERMETKAAQHLENTH